MPPGVLQRVGYLPCMIWAISADANVNSKMPYAPGWCPAACGLHLQFIGIRKESELPLAPHLGQQEQWDVSFTCVGVLLLFCVCRLRRVSLNTPDHWNRLRGCLRRVGTMLQRVRRGREVTVLQHCKSAGQPAYTHWVCVTHVMAACSTNCGSYCCLLAASTMGSLSLYSGCQQRQPTLIPYTSKLCILLQTTAH